jgi:hypothetical protein
MGAHMLAFEYLHKLTAAEKTSANKPSASANAANNAMNTGTFNFFGGGMGGMMGGGMGMMGGGMMGGMMGGGMMGMGGGMGMTPAPTATKKAVEVRLH